MYYAVSVFGSQASAIGYATSSTMDYGSWTDHGATGIASAAGKSYNAIDPALVTAADGTYYLNFGSFYGDIYQVAMDSAGAHPSAGAYNVAYNSSGTHAVEGSYMYYRSPYYYLFFSSGSCCGYDASKPAAGDEYAVHVCRSETATGGFVDAAGVSCTEGGGTLVLASHGTVYGPGGQGIMVDTAEGGAVMYYHYGESCIPTSSYIGSRLRKLLTTLEQRTLLSASVMLTTSSDGTRSAGRRAGLFWNKKLPTCTYFSSSFLCAYWTYLLPAVDTRLSCHYRVYLNKVHSCCRRCKTCGM